MAEIVERAGETLLGVPHLAVLWARCLHRPHEAVAPAHWAADEAVIYGLGLGLLDTLSHLHGARPAFESFERWILERNGGVISPERIFRVNQAVSRCLGPEPGPRIAASSAPAGPLTAEDLRFWDENGYVVLRAAVSGEAAAAAASAIWDFLGMEADRPESWYGSDRCEGLWVPMVRHPAFDANRESGRIRAAFAQLWRTEDLMVSVDRGGFNPPERRGHAFCGQGLHWDTSLTPPIPLDIQGILYLSDTPPEQGAFRCVPGFHRRIDQWLADLPPEVDPRAQDFSRDALAIGGKAGDMVIWHAALPHGASPNRGVRPRLAQYISWWPIGRADDRAWR